MWVGDDFLGFSSGNTKLFPTKARQTHLFMLYNMILEKISVYVVNTQIDDFKTASLLTSIGK